MMSIKPLHCKTDFFPEKEKLTVSKDEAFLACHKIRQFIKDDEKRCYRILEELGVKIK